MKQVEYQYVTEFKCLKDECIDTCCRDWLVTIDKESYTKLDSILASPEYKNKISHSIRKTGESTNKYAYIEFLENGQCPFYIEGLCEIHSNYGEQLLPALCKSYPKISNNYYLTEVISASLSCPEVISTIIRSKEPFARIYKNSIEDLDDNPHVINPDKDLRDKLVYTLRNGLISILEMPELNAPEEILYIISLYSLSISEIYDSNNLRESDFIKVYEANDYYSEQKNIEKMLEKFQLAYSDLSDSLLLIVSVLKLRDSRVNDKFSRLVSDTVAGIQKHINPELDVMDINVISNNYVSLKALVDKDAKKVVDKYLSLYMNNTLRRENPGKMSSIFLYTYMIVIRFSILSFLLHLNALMPHDDIDVRFTNIMYLFSRAFDHDTAMMTSIYDALNHEGLISIDYAANFLRV